MSFIDKKLVCKDCGKEFVWSAGEQKFFADKGFTNAPIRCADCRKKKKEGTSDKTSQISQVLQQIKCKNCGKTSEIPFQPRNPDNILCSECFEKSLTQKKSQS